MRRALIGLCLAGFMLTGGLVQAIPESAQPNPGQMAADFEARWQEPTAPVTLPPYHGATSLDETVGEVDTVGDTWWDEQQYTSCGKQIAVDHQGYVHHVWTKRMLSDQPDRHIYYNVWSPSLTQFILPNAAAPSGAQVDAAPLRAGYTTMDVNADGFAFPMFHQVADDSIPHAAVSTDLGPHMGGFTTADVPWVPGVRILYPKVVCDPVGDLQVISSQAALTGTSDNPAFYSRGRPHFTGGFGDSVSWTQGFTPLDTAYWLSSNIAASIHGSRVAMAWMAWDSRLEYGPNVYLRTSEDGGITWGLPVNVTNYPPIDTMCVANGGTLDTCNRDTLRPYWDVTVMLDPLDNAHVFFTTHFLYFWTDTTDTTHWWSFRDGVSSIWHWNEAVQEFNIVAEQPIGSFTNQIGKSQLMCQRPNVAIDTLTGYLYCAYQKFDTTQWSLSNSESFYQADAWVAVSTDNGRTWSAGTNVTNTDGGQNAAPGLSRSERDISVAQFVTGGILHMQYQLDLDAGTGINGTPEGSLTLNPILYQRIPVELLPARPLINPFRALHADSVGYPWGLDTSLAAGPTPARRPGEIALYQNYPNPFNSQTMIQFDLSADSRVSLRVFDVLGREVAVLIDAARMTAGVQRVAFDATGLASGIYFYRLEAGTMQQTRKLVLMR